MNSLEFTIYEDPTSITRSSLIYIFSRLESVSIPGFDREFLSVQSNHSFRERIHQALSSSDSSSLIEDDDVCSLWSSSSSCLIFLVLCKNRTSRSRSTLNQHVHLSDVRARTNGVSKRDLLFYRTTECA